jgi:lipoprotein-anchoring transpeptidase ErfK/SrfK
MLSLRWLLLLCALLLNACAGFDFGARPTGKASIVIDLTQQRAYLYRGKTLALESKASTGREGYNTPAGKFHVIEKDLNHRSTIYGEYVANGRVVVPGVDVRKTPRPPGTQFEGAPMPYFLRIVGAVGMHAGEVPHYPASHGCIRLPQRYARQFYEQAKVGTPVTIRR